MRESVAWMSQPRTCHVLIPRLCAGAPERKCSGKRTAKSGFVYPMNEESLLVSRTVGLENPATRASGAVQNTIVASMLRGFTLALTANLLIAGILVVGLMTVRGETLRQAVSATAPLKARSLLDPAATDSWNAMLSAHRGHLSDPDGSLYDVFFAGSTKFQYPPTALIFFDLLPTSVTNDDDALHRGSPLRRLLNGLSRLAIGLTLLFSALAVKALLERFTGRALNRVEAVLVLGGCGVLGLMFYPLVRGYQLGQIQVFLNCLMAISALALVRGKVFLSGICLGICSLIKPQYGLVLVWAALHKEWRLVQGMCMVGLPALAISLTRYGLGDHLDYLKVLSNLSRYGEAFWANQSINGLLQRAFGSTDVLHFNAHQFPPYNPVIHAITLITYCGFIAASLWTKASGSDAHLTRLIGVALVITAATIGSPIAWEHHYGALFPYVLLALPLALKVKPLGTATMPVWIAAYCAMAMIFLRPELVYVGPARGLLGMYIFLGGAMFFMILVCLGARRRAPNRSEVGR